MNEIDLQKARMRAVEAIDKLAEKERLGELMKKHGISRTTRSRSSYMEIFPPPWRECASEGTARWQRSYLRSARSVVKRGSKPQFVVGLEVCHRHLWCCKSLHRSSGAG